MVSPHPENTEPMMNERTEALEELWAAVKDWRVQPLGYSSKLAMAVERMNNVERKTSR
jgi:hypothetical protein